jgi:hypothetical protein
LALAERTFPELRDLVEQGRLEAAMECVPILGQLPPAQLPLCDAREPGPLEGTGLGAAL